MKIIHAIVLIVTALLALPNAHAFTDEGFSNPFGIAVDSSSSYIYISNMNGDPKGRDDNGFISRLKGDGAVDKMRFVDGASKGVQLNAPKGMAIAEERLYVADIDKLRAFDIKSGKFLFDVNFGNLPVQHLYDVTLGPDMSLYVADGPANTIYRVDLAKQHEVTIFTSGEGLGQPHGIAWFTAKQIFAIAGWSSGKVTAYDRAGKRQITPAILLRTLEGITADNAGNLFVTSSGLSAIYRIGADFALHTFKPGFKSPAGVAYSGTGNEVVAASSDAGTVESFAIEAEMKGSSVVADFIQPAPKPTPKPAEGEGAGADGEGTKAEEKAVKPMAMEKPPAEAPATPSVPEEPAREYVATPPPPARPAEPAEGDAESAPAPEEPSDEVEEAP